MTRLLTTSRRLLALVALLAFAGNAQAQEWTLGAWNSQEEIESFFADTFMVNPGTLTGDDAPFIDLFPYEDGDPQKGAGAMQADYRVQTAESWGGSIQLTRYHYPEMLDISDFTHIGVYHKSLFAPTFGATLRTRIKLHDASGPAPAGDEDGVPDNTGEVEDWYSESVTVLTPAHDDWQLWSVPLEDLKNDDNTGNDGCCGSTGFHQPGWSGQTGNERLDLDSLFGYSLEWVADLPSGAPPTTTVEGSIVYDNFHVTGVRYNLVEGFDDFAERVAAGSIATWGASANNTIQFTDLTAEQGVEGAGAVELAWHATGDQSWGGGTNAEEKMPFGTFHADMDERTHLSLFYNVTEAASVADQVGLRIIVLDSSTTGVEGWVYENHGILDSLSNGWRRLLIPLEETPAVNGSATDDGLTLFSWAGSTMGDNKLDFDKIVGYKIEFTVAAGGEAEGEIQLDRFTGYGFENTDVTAPTPATGLAVSTEEFQNIVSWTDVDGEVGETYNVYYSTSPIDDLEAETVYVLETDIAEDQQLAVHQLLAPLEDQNVTYHYAVTVTDRAGNTSEISATSSATTNEAMGVGTVSLNVPAGWAADGSISEWTAAEIMPIHMEKGTTFGYVPTGGQLVDDAQDLSADVYVAMDETAVYYAIDVTDDVVVPVPEDDFTERWFYDGAEIFFGLYETRGFKHGAYQSVGETDYQTGLFSYTQRYDKFRELTEPDSIASGENYSFTVKPGGGGYVIEGRLPFEAFTYPEATPFVPRNGTMIPFELNIMDNDVVGTSAREGQLTFSANNDDNAWQSPANWGWLFVGDQLSVGVEKDGEATADALRQNYPNPFKGTTAIKYQVKKAGQVSVRVYNVLGQEVATLVDGVQTAGAYTITFDASALASGTYLYQIRSDRFVQTKTMTVVR